MGLSYYYEFTAPPATTTGELEEFLREVEVLAISLGFAPTTVLNIPFDVSDPPSTSSGMKSDPSYKEEYDGYDAWSEDSED